MDRRKEAVLPSIIGWQPVHDRIWEFVTRDKIKFDILFPTDIFAVFFHAFQVDVGDGVGQDHFDCHFGRVAFDFVLHTCTRNKIYFSQLF